MPVKELDEPCWVISRADGTLAGQWEEQHFAVGDDAAEALERARDDGEPLVGVESRQLAFPCLIVICDVCGKSWTFDDTPGAADHYASKTEAVNQSGAQVRDDGTVVCEECRPAGEGWSR